MRNCVLQARYVLKNLVRDWSAEGQLERQESYGRIIQELKARFADW
jgi:carnosine N-methyltransferase